MLTCGRIKLNSEPRLVSTGPLCGERSLVWKLKCDVCGQFMCTCSCVFPLCCLSWYAHQMCRSHKLLAEIDLLEYLHRERVVLFINFSDVTMSTVVVVDWGVRCQAYAFALSFKWRRFFQKKKKNSVVRFKILGLCNILIYDYIFALNAH